MAAVAATDSGAVPCEPCHRQDYTSAPAGADYCVATASRNGRDPPSPGTWNAESGHCSTPTRHRGGFAPSH